jgi:hypothetical protein
VTVNRSAAASGYRRLIDPFLWRRSYAARERALAGAAGSREAPTRLESGITLTDLSFAYPGGAHEAVSGVSATLPAGSVVAIVGEYGSGKTTLVKLLCKFYRPTTGTITVDGTELAAIGTASWRAGLSVTFQDFGRYQTTFRENVLLGSLESRAERARDLRTFHGTGTFDRQGQRRDHDRRLAQVLHSRRRGPDPGHGRRPARRGRVAPGAAGGWRAVRGVVRHRGDRL